MIIGVASGKGGTGKTTVAVNLAWCAPEPALLLDCDVEEPNAHLFFDVRLRRREEVCIPVPVLDESKCTACGLCSRICEFNAVAFLGDRPLFFPDLCHGCGGCLWVCPEGAITEVGREIGVVEVADAGPCTLVQGRLHVGRALSPPLIKAVKRFAERDRLTIIDGPPGTACPLTAALAGSDYVLLVAEPTPFGLHDLGLAVGSVRRLRVPFGVVVNRGSGGSTLLREYCRQQDIEVLLEIPENHQVAAACARGRIAAAEIPGIRRSFDELWSAILRATAAAGLGTEGLRHAHV
jgi:MinD superfamily P-loop ATPase